MAARYLSLAATMTRFSARFSGFTGSHIGGYPSGTWTSILSAMSKELQQKMSPLVFCICLSVFDWVVSNHFIAN
jgi:hypothetical protein